MRVNKGFLKINNISKNDFQSIYSTYKNCLLDINLDLTKEFNKKLELFNFKTDLHSSHLMILRDINERDSELFQVLTHAKRVIIDNNAHFSSNSIVRDLIPYEENWKWNLINNKKEHSYFLNSLITKDAVFENKMYGVTVASGLSDERILRHISLQNFINFKVNISKMYLKEKNFTIPLQSKFNKKNIYLKDLMNNEYLYNMLIKDNKIFNVNFKFNGNVRDDLEFLDYLQKTTDCITHTSAFELMITDKSHLISDDCVISLNNYII